MTQPSATDEQIVEAYSRSGNVHVAARELGVSHSFVHRRLQRLGKSTPLNTFTEADRDRLRAEYVSHRNTGTLDALAASMGRTKPFICRQARALGLTDKRTPKPYLGRWTSMDDAEARDLMRRFRESPLDVGSFCAAEGFDDLGFTGAMSGRFTDEYEAIVETKAAPGSCYRIGREFEYAVRDDLVAAGYHAVRSYRSKSPADLIAVRTGAILFVQCRLGGALPVAEWNELFALASSVNARPILASKTPDGAIDYRLLIEPKDGSRRAQPMERFDPAEPPK